MTRRIHRTTFLLTLAMLLGWPGGSNASSPGIAVIVNAKNGTKELDKDQLRAIFQTKNTQWSGGAPILALNLPSDNDARNSFDEVVLGMKPDEVARYWIDRKIRGGARPPKRVPSAKLMLAVVEKKREAIGYLREDQLSDDVRVIARIRAGRVIAP